MKIYRFLIFTILLLSAGCATVPQHQTSVLPPDPLPLNCLLSMLPAANPSAEKLIIQNIARHGQAGVADICAKLASPDSIVQVQSTFALHGLVHLAGVHNDYSDRVALGILNALKTDLPAVQKTFLLEQLQQFAGRRVVDGIAPFLIHPQLHGPAARALVATGGPAAGDRLLAALDETSGAAQLSVIDALGQLHYTPACEKLAEMAGKTSGKNNLLLFALSEIGCESALPLLEKAVRQDPGAGKYLVRYAQRLVEGGQRQKPVRICRSLLDNDYPGFLRLAALDVLLQTDGGLARADLLTMITGPHARMRRTALLHVENMDSSYTLFERQNVLQDAGPASRADILDMIGRQPDAVWLPLVKDALNDSAVAVRCAALRAMSRLDPEQAVDSVFGLGADAPAEEIETAHTVLSTVPHTVVVSRVIEADRLPDNLTVHIVDLLATRGEKRAVSLFISAVKSDNEAVRISGYTGLSETADSTHLDVLLELLSEASPAETRARQAALTGILRRAGDQDALLQKVSAVFRHASRPVKKSILSVYKNTGSETALHYVLDQTGKDDEMQDNAIRILADWPNEKAAGPLFDIAENHEELKYRIQAIRGLVHIFDRSEMGTIRALEFLKRLMNAARRPEEQRLVLSRFPRVHSPSALKIVAAYLDKPGIGYDAYSAAVKLAASAGEFGGELSTPQMVRALIEVDADVSLLAKIAEQPLLQNGNNQPPEGFTALFNGKDLSGWKGLVGDPVKRAHMTPQELAAAQTGADRQMRDHWHVVDGVLYFDGDGANLCTEKDYCDFELLVDWKIEKNSDSGIYLRGAPQVQIWDAAARGTGSGGLFNNQKHPDKPLVTADVPAGRWNTFRIIMRGEKVTVYLNEKLIVDHVVMENYWERDKPIYPAGAIELQAHHTPVYFRNIYIKELEPHNPLFSGYLLQHNSLDGWQVIGGPPDSWTVKDGVLATNGKGGGWISSVREFADFRLELEFRLPPDGNSGVFIRAPHSGDPAYTGLEIQVLDDAAQKYAHLQPWQYTGSIYGVVAPAMRAGKPAGEWQKMTVQCRGPKILVILNGKQIVLVDLADYTHKLPKHPGLKRRKGYIGLQNHSTRVEYRNIYLQEI